MNRSINPAKIGLPTDECVERGIVLSADNPAGPYANTEKEAKAYGRRVAEQALAELAEKTEHPKCPGTYRRIAHNPAKGLFAELAEKYLPAEQRRAEGAPAPYANVAREALDGMIAKVEGCAESQRVHVPGPLPAPSALDIQEGGNHYKQMKIQPAEYCHANKIEKLEGDVIAYVSRWRLKNGLEDLRKARHTLDLLIELETKAPRT